MPELGLHNVIDSGVYGISLTGVILWFRTIELYE